MAFPGCPPEVLGSTGALFEANAVRPLETDSGIHLLHGHQQLDGLNHAYDLQAALDRRPFVRSLPYDIILFDTPPALGLRHLAPVVWADQIIAPIDADAYALSGLQKTIQRIEDLKVVNPTLTLRLIANRLLPRVRHQQEVYPLPALTRQQLESLFAKLGLDLPKDLAEAGPLLLNILR